MGKGGFEFEFRPNTALLRTILMLRAGFGERRAAALQRYFAYTAAETMQQEVLSRIPQTSEYSAYRQSLRVVQSGAFSNPVFSVESVATEAEEVEKDTDILYFKAKGKGRLDPGLAVLLRFQPWTQDTLPFVPSAKKAALKKRKVSKQEVIEVRKSREEDRPEWTRALSEAGIRVSQNTDVTAQAKAVPDMVYTALRLEFGLGGSKTVGHWRPALRATKVQALKLFNKSNLAKVLLGWKDSRWQKWRDLRTTPVSTATADSFENFQSKITG